MAREFFHTNSRPGKVLFLAVCTVLFFLHVSLSVAYANGFTLADAISQSINQHLDAETSQLSSRVGKNREALDNLGIGQQRVSQTVARLQGKKSTPMVIDSKREELHETFRLLDDALFEIQALADKDKNTYNQQLKEKAARQISYKTSLLYWQTHGIRSSTANVIRLKNNINTALQVFINAKQKQPADAEAQKQKLLKLLAAIKQYEAENIETLKAFSAQTGMSNEALIKQPFLSSNSPALPDIDVDIMLIDENILMQHLAPKMPSAKASTKIAQAQQPDPKKDSIKQKAYGYLKQLTPSLDTETDSMDDKALKLWLSTSKHLAFDLYNKVDRLQREMLLKQEPANTKPNPAELPAAKVSRARLAWMDYADERASYALIQCNRDIFDRLEKRKQQRKTPSLTGKIDAYQASYQQLINNRSFYKAYAELFSKMLKLRDSVYPARKLLSNQAQNNTFIRDINFYLTQNRKDHVRLPYTCYQDEAVISNQQQQQRKLVAEKESALRQVAELTSKVKAMEKTEADRQAAIKNARSSWINRQRSGNFTMQIAVNKNPKVLQALAKRYKLGKRAHVYPAVISGRTQYVLIYGSYKNRELAYVAQFKLPQAIQDKQKVVIRRFNEVQQQFMTGFAMTRLVK